MKKLGQVALLGTMWASAAFGLTSNCPTASGTPAQPNANGVSWVIPGNGNTTPNALADLNALNPGDANFPGANGCGYIDKVFTNFQLATNTLEAPLGGNSGGGLAGTYTFFSNTDTITFADVRGTAGNNSDQNQNDGVRNFTDAVNGANSFSVTYIVSVGSGLGTQFQNLSFFVNGAALSGTGAASVSTNVCSGYTGTTATANFSSCSSGTLLQNTTNLVAGTNSINFSLSPNVSRVAITQTFTLNAGTSGTSSFQTFGVTIAETPEPSTFGMMGAALIGFSCMLRRRKA